MKTVTRRVTIPDATGGQPTSERPVETPATSWAPPQPPPPPFGAQLEDIRVVCKVSMGVGVVILGVED